MRSEIEIVSAPPIYDGFVPLIFIDGLWALISLDFSIPVAFLEGGLRRSSSF